MSSNNSKVPPYSENPSSSVGLGTSAQAVANRMAGAIQTCSIKDFCHDYFLIVKQSSTSYLLRLTVDPTPIYRIELSSDPTKMYDVQIFPASDISLPAIAAARLRPNSKSKHDPVAMICTSEPHLVNAMWRPLMRTSSFSVESYQTNVPIVTVPGMAPTPHQLSWRTGALSDPYFQLWWDGPLPLVPSMKFMPDQRGSEYVFTTVARRTAKGGENLIEMRRGGGLDFELSVILEVFVILHLEKKVLI